MVKRNMGYVNGTGFVRIDPGSDNAYCFNLHPNVQNKPIRRSEKELGFLENVCRVKIVASAPAPAPAPAPATQNSGDDNADVEIESPAVAQDIQEYVVLQAGRSTGLRGRDIYLLYVYMLTYSTYVQILMVFIAFIKAR